MATTAGAWWCTIACKKKGEVAVLDDWKSYIHIIYGFLVSIHILILIVGAVVFTVYQFVEKEKKECKIGDIIEFLLGVVIGVTLFQVLPLLL